MKKTFQQITIELNEAKFKLPSDQKEVKRETEKVAGKTINVVYAQSSKRKIYVYIDGNVVGEPFRNLKDAQKEMKNIKLVMKQMGEENISKEEILGVINETNI